MLFLLIVGVCGFFDQFFGGGGGAEFHFSFGGGGGFEFNSQGGNKRLPPASFPAGFPSEISEKFSFLKGTEWLWNNWKKVRFFSDGSFEAPSAECQQAGQCIWSSSDDEIFILWGSAGIHRIKVIGVQGEGFEVANLKNARIEGKKEKTGEKCFATFTSIFDFENRQPEKDLYAILGFSEGGPEIDISDIKKNFRNLSREYHPDKNKAADAQEKFTALNSAHDILSDPVKRMLYDSGGIESVKAAEKGQISKLNDMHINIEVSLEQLYTGDSIEIGVTRRIVCAGCRLKKRAICASCGKCPHEVKTVVQQMGMMIFQQQVEVPSKEFCKQETKKINVIVEAGAVDGHQIVFENMGEQRPGNIPGNVIVTLKQKKHQKFTRIANDLHFNVDISLTEALVGFKKTIPHLDGHPLVISNDQVTQFAQVLTIQDEGIGKYERGNAFAKINVLFPKKVNEYQKQQLLQIF